MSHTVLANYVRLSTKKFVRVTPQLLNGTGPTDRSLRCTCQVHCDSHRANHRETNRMLSSFMTRSNLGMVRRWYAVTLTPREEPPLTVNDIKRMLTEHGVSFQEGHSCLIVDCLVCLSHSRGKTDPGKLFINRTAGAFLCLKCLCNGSLQDFQDLLRLAKMGERKLLGEPKRPEWLPSERDVQLVLQEYERASPISSFNETDLLDILAKFNFPRISRDVFIKYEARISSDRAQILIPIHAVDDMVVGLQKISIPDSPTKSCTVDVLPRQLTGVLLGWKQRNKRQDTIVISSSLLDTLVVAQETNMCVVGLPQEKYLPLEVLPMLEPYNKIVLWLGNDVASWERAKMFARKLNDRRCYFIRPDESHPKPLDVIRLGLDVGTILKSAHPIAHKAITTFHSLRMDVFAELAHVEQVAGIKWQRYPLLTKLLKGHRRGEFTVFTGPTGSGKTTFISEYSLDLCMQGVRTLWGSFEIRNIRLAKMMLTQFALTPLDRHLDQYDHWADQFEKLPLYFLTFHGPQSIRSVLDAMRHAVYVHDIEHVVVDNLQFMLGSSDSSRIQDRFWRQDMVVSSFRQFATVHNCHVTIVIHPRKENSDELSNMSIFGGAKASQEADNVLILQDKRLSSLRGRKYIQVTKNRYDGDLGIVPLEFDRDTLSFVIKRKPQKSQQISNLDKTSDDKP